MREILFRGKRLDNGEWVSSGNLITFNDEGEGKQFFIPEANAKCISTHDEQDNIISFNSGTFFKVCPSTVGQFTGLIDKNGKKIFEGDIVRVRYDSNDGKECEIRAVEYNSKECCYYPMAWVECCDYCDAFLEFIEIEVLGNIHDNPELLGGEGDGN